MASEASRVVGGNRFTALFRGQRGWVMPACLFAVAALTYAATAGRGFINGDLRMTYFASWHLSVTGNPWLDHVQIPHRLHVTAHNIWVLHAANGHTVVGRTPGVILATMPAYLLAHQSSMTYGPGALTAALLTACTVALMFQALRLRLGDRAALLSAVVFGFTTPVWSVAANGVWPHTVTLVGIAGMAWASSRDRWWLVGIFGGIALWGRIHAAIIVAVVGLLVAWHRRRPGIAVRVGTGSTAALALMCVWTRWMYGAWNPVSFYNTETFSDYAAQHRVDVVNQLGFWVSPDRGILVWTPLVLVLLGALIRSWRDLPDWSRALVWGGLLYTVVQAAFNRFSGGDIFYGYRYGLEFLACAAPALAFAVPRTGRVARALVGPVIGLQLLAFSLGSISDDVWLPLREAWHRNAFVNAVAGMGAIGWIMVALAMFLGGLGQRLWQSASATPATTDPAVSDTGNPRDDTISVAS